MDAPAMMGAALEMDESEARRELLRMAGRRLEPVPADLVVGHLQRLYPFVEAGWLVQRAALEAVLRRWRYAERDGLAVARRPRGGRYGAFACKRAGDRAVRPYETRIVTVEPLDASCDCPDFVRGSLGLCKHVLVVLAELARRKRLPKMRREEAAALGNSTSKARLTWQPARPLLGPGDALAQVRWTSSRKPTGRLARVLVVDDAEIARATKGWSTWRLDARLLSSPRRREPAIEALWAWAERHPDETDPAVRALLDEERKRLSHAPKIGGKQTRQALSSMRRRLYPYQTEGVRRFFESGRLLLADDMGLGKTAQAIAACHVLHRTGIAQRGLLVVPASLRLQWEREWRSFTDVPVQVVDGSPRERKALYERTRRGFVVLGYEQLMRDLPHVLRWAPPVVVLDEAQRIKNWATKTAASVKRIAAPYRLVLTGTPLENRLEELASIMDWVDDRAIEPKWRLEPWHTVVADGRREVVGARNLEVLRCRLAPVMLRRRRPEVIAQLPARTDTVVPVPLTEAQTAEHEALRQPIAQLMQRGRRRPLTQAEFLKLMQLLTTQRIISNGLAQLAFEGVWPSIRHVADPDEALISTLNAPKLLELRALVEQIAVEQQRKLVVFSQWRRMLSLARWATRPILEGAGLRAAFFTGDEGQKRRMQNVVELHEDPALRVLFATDAGGVGLNLQRAATCCINLDLPWNPAVLEQRIARIHRLGQTQPIDVYNLVGQGCIEERIAGILSNKQALFSELFDGQSDQVLFDGSARFLSQLERIVEPAEIAASGEPDESDDADETDEEDFAPLHAGPEEADASADGAIEERALGSPPALPHPERVREAFAGLKIERTPSGGMRIEADPEAAAALGALLEGLGRLISEAAP